MNELVDKYEVTGLLDGLSDVDKIILSIKFESAVIKILSYENSDYYTRTTEGLIFPIIRRVYNMDSNRPFRSLDPIHLLEDFNNYSKTPDCESILSITTWNNHDMEAELCMMYSENYRKKNMKYSVIEPLKVILPHRLIWTRTNGF